MSGHQPASFRLEVRTHAPPPKPYKWEIFRNGEPIAVERSMVSFISEATAERDGTAALERWVERTTGKVLRT